MARMFAAVISSSPTLCGFIRKRAGSSGSRTEIWLALMAPVGVPDSIVQKINADLRVVLAQPDLVEKFAAIGTYPQPLSPTETAAFIRAEQQLWWPVVREVEGKR